LLSVLVFVLNLVASPAPSVFGILVLVVGIVGFLIAALCAIPAYPLTSTGAEQRDYVAGLRVYLSLAEADRFRVLQSPEGAERVDAGDESEVVKLYEKLLPWAVLWGVEERWSTELAVHYDNTSAPGWYVGSAGFNAAAFSVSMRGFSSTAATAAAPVYTSSGSGGSFGGGFSGGGGGGGGGGGR
jgi:hypothetical protein